MERNTSDRTGKFPGRRRIIWLADLEHLARNPNRLAEVQSRLGVDTVWLESSRYHTAGYALSGEVWESSPFQDWRDRPGLARHRQARRLPEGAFPVLPGVLAGADDSALLAVIETADRLGVRVWGHLGLWSYGGMVYPELAVQTLAGGPVGAEEDRWGACFCPNKPVLNHWLAACLKDSLAKYTLHGMEIDHARYIPPQSLPNLLVCGCPDCVRRAAELGYDLPALAEIILGSLARLERAPASLIQGTLAEAGTLLEALDILVTAQAASRWFSLRARFISTAIQEMAAAAGLTGGGSFEFGIDVLPPSVALLGGHPYADLTCLSFFTGGFGTIGWEKVGLSTCLEWGRFLLRRWPALEEEFVVAQLLRLAGFSGRPLPRRLAGLEQPAQSWLAHLEADEIHRMAELRPEGMPVYPPASLPGLGAGGLETVCRSIREHGLDGVILAGLENLAFEEEQRVAAALEALR